MQSVSLMRCKNEVLKKLHLKSTIKCFKEVKYTFQKSNATRLWSIIFLLSCVFIHQVCYPWKVCLFAFRLMPYLLGLFLWGACRLSKFGVKSKSKTCKMDQSVWEMHVMPSFVLYARVLTAHSLCWNCPKLRRSEWAVGTHAWIQPQKGERKPSFPIQSDRFCKF